MEDDKLDMFHLSPPMWKSALQRTSLLLLAITRSISDASYHNRSFNPPEALAHTPLVYNICVHMRWTCTFFSDMHEHQYVNAYRADVEIKPRYQSAYFGVAIHALCSKVMERSNRRLDLMRDQCGQV